MSRLDSIVSEAIRLKARAALAQKRRFRLKRPPRPLPPKPLERRYFDELRTMVAELRQLAREMVIPAVGGLRDRAQALRPKADAERQDDFTGDLDSLMETVRGQFHRKYPNESVVSMARGILDGTALFNARQMSRVFQAVLGVDIKGYEPWLSQEINAALKANVKLITSISEDYFDRVEDTILRGVQSATLTEGITSEIEDIGDVTENRARLIARDQVSKFNGNLTRLRQTNVGVTRYQWSTSRDERVRPSHEEKDGNIYKWSDPPADTGHPGEDFQCRCVAIPVFEDSGTEE